MNALPWLKSRSDGTGTLSHHLTVAVFDYQRAFGHEPKLIRVPFWRGREMSAEFIAHSCQNPDSRFRGIPFRWSITSDYIELFGTTKP